MIQRYEPAPLVPTKSKGIWLYDGKARLKEVPKPGFYDLATSDGTPYPKIALLHGSDILATTVYQSCRYWATGEQCKFCTIPVSQSTGDTILDKSPEQVTEVVRAAQKEGVIGSVLLTTGTTETSDMGCERLYQIVKAIRGFSRIPIGVQFEPPEDQTRIDELVDAGVNAIGMHIECADEDVRRKACPGKYRQATVEQYRASWKHALSRLGRGNVSTFFLQGLGEDAAVTLQMADEISEMGVMPVVLPVRPSNGSQLADYVPSYVGDLNGSTEFYKEVGKILHKHRLNPAKTAAGCHRCGACTPIQEAYDWARAYA
jgi:radical SAM protein (TIGR04043 family)